MAILVAEWLGAPIASGRTVEQLAEIIQVVQLSIEEVALLTALTA